MCVLRNPDGTDLAERNTGGSCQKRSKNQEVNGTGMWSLHSTHWSFLIADAEQRNEFAAGGIDQGTLVHLGWTRAVASRRYYLSCTCAADCLSLRRPWLWAIYAIGPQPWSTGAARALIQECFYSKILTGGRSPCMNDHAFVFASFYSLFVRLFPAGFYFRFQCLLTGIPANRMLS